MLSRIVVPKGDTNAMRWKGQRGHYEAWYLTFNVRPRGLGLWLRYTVEAPLAGEPFCELWAHLFDAERPAQSFGLRQRHPLGQLARPRGALLEVAGAVLEEGRARGSLASARHSLAWDLTFDSDHCAVHLAPWPLRALGVGSTAVVFANPDTRLRGALVVDGQAVRVEREPGSQTHLWGTKHAERWAWGHCNAFAGRDDCAVDGVAAFVQRGGRLRGPLTAVYLRYRGEDFPLNTLPRMLLARGRLEFPSWTFSGCARGLSFEGTFRAAPDRLLQVEYADPDGERSYCANSEIGDLVLEVRRGGRLIDRLHAAGSAHLEFGSRRPWPEVRASVGSLSER